jgi:hypothetical protein
MTARFGVTLAMVLAFAPLARGAADLDFRESRVGHVCKGGANNSAVCCEDGDCPGGSCIVDYSKNKLSGTLTIILDNDVRNGDGSGLATQVRAGTVLFEAPGKSGPLLAQTYQKLDGSSLAALVSSLGEGPTDEFGFPASEGLLKANVQPAVPGPIDVSFLFFRTVDAEMVKELRIAAGLPPVGPELVVVQEDKASLRRYVNRFAPSVPGDINSVDTDPMASVLKVKVTFRFVPPKPPQC